MLGRHVFLAMFLAVTSSACATAPAGSWPWAESSDDGGINAGPDARPLARIDATTSRPDAPPAAPADAAPVDAKPASVLVVVEANLTYTTDPEAPTLTCTGLPDCGSVHFACPGCGVFLSGSAAAAYVNSSATLSFSLAGISSVTAATTTASVRGQSGAGGTFALVNQSEVGTPMTIPVGEAFSVLTTTWDSFLLPGGANRVAAVRDGQAFLLRRLRVEMNAVLE